MVWPKGEGHRTVALPLNTPLYMVHGDKRKHNSTETMQQCNDETS